MPGYWIKAVFRWMFAESLSARRVKPHVRVVYEMAPLGHAEEWCRDVAWRTDEVVAGQRR
jgi:hypothetical protein